ncbi:MAG: multicopper oxidase domain-containing protein [Candidatus Bathyarchaeia archaeon]
MANTFKSHLPLILIGILAIAFLVGAASMLIFNLQAPLVNSSPNKTQVVILLYEGELSNGKFGFGTSPTNLTSPGPTIGFSTSDVVNLTVVNVGKLPHAFAITTMPQDGAPTLFSAVVGSASNPLQPGQAGSVIFTPDNAAFTYWYISPVSGDVAAGMYGAVVVSSVTGPAFP